MLPARHSFDSWASIGTLPQLSRATLRESSAYWNPRWPAT